MHFSTLRKISKTFFQQMSLFAEKLHRPGQDLRRKGWRHRTRQKPGLQTCLCSFQLRTHQLQGLRSQIVLDQHRLERKTGMVE